MCPVPMRNRFPGREEDSGLEELDKLLNREPCLTQDAFEGSWGQVLVVDGEGDSQFWPGAVEEPSVAAGLVVNIKPSSL